MKHGYLLPLIILITCLGCNSPGSSGSQPHKPSTETGETAEDLKANAEAIALDKKTGEQRRAARAAWLASQPKPVSKPLVPVGSFTSCTAANGEWRCSAAKPMAAGGARPAYPPYSWSIPAWFLDPGNSSGTASDSNNCTTVTTPCVHWFEIVQRWGTVSPILAQATTITIMSSVASQAQGQADPIIFKPIISTNAQVTIQGALTAANMVSTGTLATVVAKNRSGKQALNVTTSGVSNLNNLIVNATHPSRSFVEFTGPNLMSQPLTGTTTVAALPTEVDTWTVGDTYTAYNLPNVNVVELYPTIADNATTNAPLIVDGLTFMEPNSTGGTSPWVSIVRIDGPIIVADCNFQKKVVSTGLGGYYPNLRFTNDAFVMNAQISGPAPTALTGGGGPVLNGDGQDFYHTQPAILGGYFVDDNTTFEDGFQNVWVDGDVIFQTGGIGATFQGVNFYGCISARPGAGILVESGTYMYPSAAGICGATSVTWVAGAGSGSIHIRPSGQSTWSYNSQTATNTFLTGTVLHMNNSVVAGCSHTNANNPDVINCNITVNVTNLDAAQGLTGFGGYAFLPGGATYTANP